MELNLQPIELEGVSKERPLIIAGPCSAETEEQVISTATQLANKGIKIFRAGIWKPRTKPGGFEGIGVDGLAWMKRVKQETGMYVATEVATAKHVYECLKAGIDILWIGARTTANERSRYSCLRKEPCQSGSGIMDRSFGTHQQRRIEASGSYPPRILVIR